MVTNFTVLNGRLDITYNLPVVGKMVRELTIVDIDYNDYVIGWLCIDVGSNQ